MPKSINFAAFTNLMKTKIYYFLFIITNILKSFSLNFVIFSANVR